MDHWRTIFPDAIIDVNYDRLVRDASAEMAPALDRLGVSAADFLADGATPDLSVRTASSWQVRKPLHQKSSGRWQNYARHLEPARQMLVNAGLI